MGWLRDLFSKKAGGLVKDIGDTVGQFVHTGEEKAEFDLKMRELQLRLEEMAFEMESKYLEDRASARRMYSRDAGIQKIYALAFLGAYFIITSITMYLVLNDIGKFQAIEVPAWVVSLISSIFGAMSAKVNTITDFFFGGSSNERAQGEELAQSLHERREAQGGANGT